MTLGMHKFIARTSAVICILGLFLDQATKVMLCHMINSSGTDTRIFRNIFSKLNRVVQ